MRAVMHSEEAPPDNVGLCSSCISKYKRNTKDFCQICFRLYGPLEIDLARHPLAASTTIEQLANSEANDEENDRMVCDSLYLYILYDRTRCRFSAMNVAVGFIQNAKE